MAVDITGSLDLAVGTELWAIWGYIANRHAELAQEGRARFAASFAAGDEVADANDELMPAMIAISAAVVSLDGFGMVIKRTGIPVSVPSSPDPARHEWVWAELKAGFDVNHLANTWPKALKELFGLRNATGGGLLHPTTVFTLAKDHPVMPGTSGARAIFTTETASRAVDFMRSVYSTCRTSVRPGSPPELVQRISGLDGTLAKLSEPPGY